MTPDTVLKWIKAGKIPAGRTPGGHHRVPYSAILPIIQFNRVLSPPPQSATGFQYCWEFNSHSGRLREGCRDCIVYRSRAGRCYQMASLPTEAGHGHLFCKESCDRCEYYQLVVTRHFTVLVVTDEEPLKASLREGAQRSDLDLHVTDCEYRCSMMVEQVRPDYVVVDCSLGTERSRDFVTLLSEDPRIPYVRIILAGGKNERPRECDNIVFAFIERPFTATMLTDLIGGTRL